MRLGRSNKSGLHHGSRKKQNSSHILNSYNAMKRVVFAHLRLGKTNRYGARKNRIDERSCSLPPTYKPQALGLQTAAAALPGYWGSRVNLSLLAAVMHLPSTCRWPCEHGGVSRVYILEKPHVPTPLPLPTKPFHLNVLILSEILAPSWLQEIHRRR